MTYFATTEDRVCSRCGTPFRTRRSGRWECRRCELGRAPRCSDETLLRTELRRRLRTERDPAARAEVHRTFEGALAALRERGTR